MTAMKRIISINLEKDLKLMFRLQAAALVLLVPFAYLFYLPVAERFAGPAAVLLQPMGTGLRVLEILFLLLMILFTLVLHELVHALLFFLFSPRHSRITIGISYGFAYAGAPHVLFPKWSYLIIGMSPALLISAACIALLMLLPDQAAPPVFTVALINASGSVGDYYVSYRIFRAPSGALIRDTGTGFSVYSQD